MSIALDRDTVWRQIDKHQFAVLSYVTPAHQARSAGIVYVVMDQKLYVRIAIDSWKAKHIRLNPNVALNVTIPKRVPFLPWIQIPQATISFHGNAKVIDAVDADHEILEVLGGASAHEVPALDQLRILEITPRGHFVTYGVGVSLLDMRDPEKARARVAIA